MGLIDFFGRLWRESEGTPPAQRAPELPEPTRAPEPPAPKLPPEEPVRFIGPCPPVTEGERLRQWMEDALAGYCGTRVRVPPPPTFEARHAAAFRAWCLKVLYVPTPEHPYRFDPLYRRSWAPYGHGIILDDSIGEGRDLERLPSPGRWVAYEMLNGARFGNEGDKVPPVYGRRLRFTTHPRLLEEIVPKLDHHLKGMGGTVTVPSVEETSFVRSFCNYVGRREVTDEEPLHPWGYVQEEWTRNLCDQGMGAMVVRSDYNGMRVDRRDRNHQGILGPDVVYRMIVHFA